KTSDDIDTEATKSRKLRKQTRNNSAPKKARQNRIREDLITIPERYTSCFSELDLKNRVSSKQQKETQTVKKKKDHSTYLTNPLLIPLSTF
ncbi:39247_t:CDS:1, partial [Gigaspora margarita]